MLFSLISLTRIEETAAGGTPPRDDPTAEDDDHARRLHDDGTVDRVEPQRHARLVVARIYDRLDAPVHLVAVLNKWSLDTSTQLSGGCSAP